MTRSQLSCHGASRDGAAKMRFMGGVGEEAEASCVRSAGCAVARRSVMAPGGGRRSADPEVAERGAALLPTASQGGRPWVREPGRARFADDRETSLRANAIT